MIDYTEFESVGFHFKMMELLYIFESKVVSKIPSILIGYMPYGKAYTLNVSLMLKTRIFIYIHIYMNLKPKIQLWHDTYYKHYRVIQRYYPFQIAWPDGVVCSPENRKYKQNFV